MRPAHVSQPVGDRLRFVFQDAVVSYSIFGVVTLGEVARTMGELSRRRYHDPIAVNLTLRSHARETTTENRAHES